MFETESTIFGQRCGSPNKNSIYKSFLDKMVEQIMFVPGTEESYKIEGDCFVRLIARPVNSNFIILLT